jgi:phosphate starvation-inducible protein PhoH and related proteins
MARKKINEGKEEVSVEVMKEYKLSYPKTIKKIKFKTYNQKRFYKAIEHPNHNIIMGHALAGAGKTYISIQKGLELLLHRLSHVEKLIIINPTVDVGSEDKLGHLPGDLMEKIAVHNESSLFIMHKIIGPVETKKLIEQGKIEFKVLNFLRGINFEKSYIILDEAQNASPQQLKTLITRISDDAKLVIEGDLSQCDKYKNNGSPAYTKSGFFDVWKRLGKLKGVYQIEFTKEDCIRSGIVKRVLERYELEEQILLGENNQYELDFSYNPFANEEESVENEEVITN